jgi:transposase
MRLDIYQANEIIAQQKYHIDELTKKLESTQRQLTILQHQMEQMLRRLYGRKSEKIMPGQLLLDCMPDFLNQVAQEQQAAAVPELAPETPVVPKAPKTPRRDFGRIPIPEHLERVEILLDIPEEQKIDPAGRPLKVIGVEVSEKLEYRPGKLIVNVYKRPQYAVPECIETAGVIAAPMPDHPIARCKADIGFIAHIIVSKYADHQPLYRQDAIFEREGVTVPRATQCSWMMQVYEGARCLEETLRAAVWERGIIFTDDTPVPLQAKGTGKVKKARLWVYVRGGPGPPLTVYDFSCDRSKQRPLAFLNGYQGYVHADAYSGYDELFKRGGIIEVGCWAHARRKFDEAVSSRPREATDILARIARLYHEVETPCTALTPEDRYRYRQEYARPILDGIFAKLTELRQQTIPSEPLRKAVEYALNQRAALSRYLENGWLRPDNNLAENAMRPIALGRKNWMFVGSERGGRAAALFMSLIQSCKGRGINPWEYFDDLLRRIMSQPVSRLRELLPDVWEPLPKDTHGLIIPATA